MQIPDTLKRILATATPADRARFAELLTIRTRARAYRAKARAKQIPPWDFATGEWATYEEIDKKTKKPIGIRKRVRMLALLGGRGSGKTQGGAWAFAEVVESVGGYDDDGNSREHGVCAPTFDSAWSVCVAGPSGILKVLGDRVQSAVYTQGKIVLVNGATIWVTGADQGAKRIQGRNLSSVWMDEVGLWSTRHWRTAFLESIRPALRKAPGIAIFTGTPKQGHPFVKWIVDSHRVDVRVMPTRDNAEHLDQEALEDLEADLLGSRLGRQELLGEFLTDIPGALFKMSDLEPARVDNLDPALIREIVVGWDPASTAKSGSDEHGIVVVARSHGKGSEVHLYVLEDASGHYTVEEASRKVAALVNRYDAVGATVEVNNGWDWITSAIGQTVPDLLVKPVTATKGKAIRPERVVVASEQGRLHFVGEELVNLTTGETSFNKLISQMTTWVEGQDSPDRLDALVWACTYHLKATAPAAASAGWSFATATMGA